MALLKPSYFATAELYDTYYQALADDYDPVKSGMTEFEEAEMTAALALVPRANITKLFAVDSGTWNTAGNWYPSGVPGAGDEVCIGEGCVCTYDLDAPSTKLGWVRVDGTLKTDITVDTAMLFDTMVVTPLGTFQDGTRAKPVPQGVVHEWIIATSNGLIDAGPAAYDTFFQSRGIIWIGTTCIYGAYKTPFLEVAAYDAPDANDTSLVLASAPTNWNVGDDIIIGSTRAKPDTWNGTTVATQARETERRTLTSSSGANLGWTGGLTYSHNGPQGTTGRTDCKAYVANLSRNIIFKPDDAAAPIHHRGHLMQMHNYRFQGQNFEVADLGRTAKHAGLANMISQVGTSLTALDPVDMSASAYWVTDHIEFGPTFKLRFDFAASGSGDIVITGTDEAGDPQTETLAYTTSTDTFLDSVKYFLTVTEITLSTTQTSPEIRLLARSRQMNQNGVRNLQTGSVGHTAVSPYTNIQGRYPLHLHKLGIAGDVLLYPPTVRGASIHDSPSWLVAHHQSHANIIDCVGCNAVGAGLVGEDSNESGLWQGNLMALMIGNSDYTIKQGNDLTELDHAVVGSPFWFTGRLIRANNNVAIDGAVGFAYNARLTALAPVASQLDQPTCLRDDGVTQVVELENVPPLAHFDDNTAIACAYGFSVVKAAPLQGHDLRTQLRRFKAWSTYQASDITYTRGYTLVDWDLFYGFVSVFGQGQDNSTGLALFTNSSDQVFVRPTIEGFGYAIKLHHGHSPNTGGVAFSTNPLNGRRILDPVLIANDTDYDDYNPDIDEILTASELNASPLSLSATGSTTNITGTKHDEFGDYDYPFGYDFFEYTRTSVLTDHGYYTDTASGNKYAMMPEWYSSALTGEMKLEMIPIDVTSGVSLVGMTDHGSMDLTNNTPPVLADFSVSVVRNTNLLIDILGRATGNTVSFAGFQQPMKGKLVNNGDGTVYYVPLSDENYSESMYVFVVDVNQNVTRATMTINVNKRALYLGRQDLL